jgi:hypothetical protein
MANLALPVTSGSALRVQIGKDRRPRRRGGGGWWRKPGAQTLTEKTAGDVSGLWMSAELDADRQDVKDLVSAVETKALIGYSFAFRVVREDWDSDYTRRTIKEVSLAYLTWVCRPSRLTLDEL